MKKEDVKQGDFFTLSKEKGYGLMQRKSAMQVMECYDNFMTVRCKYGCMTKRYDHFEKVDDISKFENICHASYFEDHRTYPQSMMNIKLSEIEDEKLMSVIYDVVENTTYHAYTDTTKSKYRFVPTWHIRRELSRRGLYLPYRKIRHAYDRLFNKGLCDRMNRSGWVCYAPKELKGHITLEDRFITSKKTE